MTELPDDLVPLPTMPYKERPASMPLDIEECRTALWLSDGNIVRAAERLKIPSLRLRQFVKNNERLKREMEEAAETLVDAAEDVVRDALRDPDRADQMARFVLQTKGKHRGWGNGGGAVKIDSTGPISITWGDGTSIGSPGDDAKVIEDAEYTTNDAP